MLIIISAELVVSIINKGLYPACFLADQGLVCYNCTTEAEQKTIFLRCQYYMKQSVESTKSIVYQITTAFFIDMEKLLIKLIWNFKGLRIKIILKKNEVGGLPFSDFKM